MRVFPRIAVGVTAMALSLSLAAPAQAQPHTGSLAAHSIEHTILPIVSLAVAPLSLLSSLIIHSGN